MSVNQRRRNMNFVVTLALEAGAEAFGSSAAQDETILQTRDGAMTFDGETFAADSKIGPVQARLIVKLAQALDWPAMVVEGDAPSADEIIIAGVPLGITAINRCASEVALRLIQKNYGHLLADTIKPLDPLSIVADALEATHTEQEVVKPADVPQNFELKPDLDQPELPKAWTANAIGGGIDLGDTPDCQRNLSLDAERDSEAGQSKREASPEVVPPEPKQFYSEFASDPDEFDIPEPPRPSAAEEMLRRSRSAALFEGWVAQKFDDPRRNSSRADRGHPAPPKTQDSGPS